jgi:HD-like signal output (HDOD) protein
LIGKRFLGKEYWKNWPSVSSEIRIHEVVEATDWPMLSACPSVLWRFRAMKGADAKTVNRLLVEDPVFSGDLAIRVVNSEHLGSPIPLTRLFS